MKTKICSKCKIKKPISKFSKDLKSKDNLSYWCKECVNKNCQRWRQNNPCYMKKWHQEHKEHGRQYEKEYRQKQKQWFENYKKNLKCEICEENHPATLVFHHRNPNNKKYCISTMVSTKKFSIQKILKEMSKCQVLCSNCHKKLHYNLRNNFML